MGKPPFSAVGSAMPLCLLTSLVTETETSEHEGQRFVGQKNIDRIEQWGFICFTYILLLFFSFSVESNSHGLEHTRLPCPPPSLRACPNSCPLSQQYHPTISSSVVAFSSCLPSFPASGSFPMSQLFASDKQSIGVSASASILPMSIQD